MFYYSILIHCNMRGQWVEWDSADSLKIAKQKFNALTEQGYTVKVLHCRDLNSGKNWIGD